MDDTLVLRFRIPHPQELAIRAPDGTPYFLVYEPDESLPSGWRPVVDKASFRNMSEMHLQVATAQGTPWVAGRKENENVFTKPGKYEVVLTDVLESDAGHPRFRCQVSLSPRERGKQPNSRLEGDALSAAPRASVGAPQPERYTAR